MLTLGVSCAHNTPQSLNNRSAAFDAASSAAFVVFSQLLVTRGMDVLMIRLSLLIRKQWAGEQKGTFYFIDKSRMSPFLPSD